jgi:hypothetical protein
MHAHSIVPASGFPLRVLRDFRSPQKIRDPSQDRGGGRSEERKPVVQGAFSRTPARRLSGLHLRAPERDHTKGPWRSSRSVPSAAGGLPAGGGLALKASSWHPVVVPGGEFDEGLPGRQGRSPRPAARFAQWVLSSPLSSLVGTRRGRRPRSINGRHRSTPRTSEGDRNIFQMNARVKENVSGVHSTVSVHPTQTAQCVRGIRAGILQCQL